jgi:hypothetical protein
VTLAAWPLVGMLWLAAAGGAAPGTMRMVVADLPYDRVWAAAVAAVGDYPLERAGDGVIQTGWRERPPRPEEPGLGRVEERATVQVEAFAERITRVTVHVEARGWREGAWVPLAGTAASASAILDRFRDARGGG